MSRILHAGRSEIFDRELFSLLLPDFQSLPDLISTPSPHFVAFLAADAAEADVVIVAEFSRRLLHAGCVYFCVWGAGCERVHDIFDEECIFINSLIMTTWHNKVSLDEALWFFLNNTHPDDKYSSTTKSSLTISIGRTDWNDHIRRRLADLNSLTRDVVKRI
jgi:hypothetical protein